MEELTQILHQPASLCIPALPVFISRVQHCFSQTASETKQRWGATETYKLIAGKEDGNKSSKKANVENTVLVYV